MTTTTLTELLISVSIIMLSSQSCRRNQMMVGGEVVIEPQQSYSPAFDHEDGEVRNVILMIGDGMGLGVVASALYANGGELTMTNLRTMGYVETSAADKAISDSPASGTAFATGHKTNYGFIGIDTTGRPLQNIPEILSPKGVHCGIVTSDMITSATSAAFYAHCDSREDEGGIWESLAASKLEFAAGGTVGELKKQDEVLQKRISRRFNVVTKIGDIDCDRDNLYLPDYMGLPERGSYLVDASSAALGFLHRRSCESGFFLLIEGGRIDVRGHCRDYNGMVLETLDFDKAVAEVVKYAESDGHTLVIVTADHETAGVVLQDVKDGKVTGSLAASYHTPSIVPLFAYGPRSKDFGCLQSNADIGKKILTVLSVHSNPELQ